MEKTIWSSDATAYDFEESRQIVSDVECIDIQDVDDDAVWRYINDDICLTLDAEESNLDVPTGRIVVFATLGLWHGKVRGSRILPEQKLSAILHAACRDSEEYTVYYDTDDGEVKARDVHHDGVNRYVFREMVSGFPPDAEEEFVESVKSGAATLEDINRFTAQLGPRVEAVYGWGREVK
jgi:hypothetical protein